MSDFSPNPLPRRIGMGYAIAAGLLLLALLSWLADGFLEDARNPNRELQTRVGVDGVAEVVLRPDRTGHYVAPGFIDGLDVTFLVDTGATLVAVDERLAQRLGLVKGMRWPMQTANGATEGWRTLLKSVRVGDIELRAVPAVIMPAGGMEEALLGMSFLQRLEMTQRGGVLTLRTQ